LPRNGVRKPLTHACNDLKSSNEICVLSQAIRPVRNWQRCRSAAEWLQKTLQKSCEVGHCSIAKFRLPKRCYRQPFASGKKRFGSGTETLKKDNRRCRITAHPQQFIRSDRQQLGSGLIAKWTLQDISKWAEKCKECTYYLQK